MVYYYFVSWRFRDIKKVKKGFIFKKTITKYEDWKYEEEVIDRHPTLKLQELRKRMKGYEKDFGTITEVYISFMCVIKEKTYERLKRDYEGKVIF